MPAWAGAVERSLRDFAYGFCHLTSSTAPEFFIRNCAWNVMCSETKTRIAKDNTAQLNIRMALFLQIGVFVDPNFHVV